MDLTDNVFFNRRRFLERSGLGIGALGLLGVTADAVRGDATALNPLTAKQPPRKARAKHLIHIFLNGGPSQVDTFDPKPMLTKFAGKPIPGGNPQTERQTGAAFPSPFKFRNTGRAGIEVSALCSCRRMHRRHLRDPLDGRGTAEPRTVVMR